MISVPNPCSRTWASLDGDDRKRFCAECGKFVYAASAYPEAGLIGKCVYLSAETVAAPRSRRAVVAGALLTTIAPLLAADGRVRVVVTDPRGTRMKGAEVVVGEHRMKTDDSGAASFAGLPVGQYAVRVMIAGFNHWRGIYTVGNAAEVQVDARMELGTLGETIELEPRRIKRGDNGRLRVLVLDPSARPIGNVETLLDFSLNGNIHGRTDENGIATFAGLPEAECHVSVSAAGFQDWKGTTDVNRRGDDLLKVRMRLTGHQETVVVKPSVGQRFLDWLSSCKPR